MVGVERDAMARSPFEIVLSGEERAELERRVACYTLPQGRAAREDDPVRRRRVEQRRDRAAVGDGGGGGRSLAEALLRGEAGRARGSGARGPTAPFSPRKRSRR